MAEYAAVLLTNHLGNIPNPKTDLRVFDHRARGFWSVSMKKLHELHACKGVLVFGPGKGRNHEVIAVYSDVRWRAAKEGELQLHPDLPDTGCYNKYKIFTGILVMESPLLSRLRSCFNGEVKFTQKGVAIVTVD